MALIKCPECGKKFSDMAPACPECGCPTNKIKTDSKPVLKFEDVFSCNKVLEGLSKGAIKEAKQIIGHDESVLLASVMNVSVLPVQGKLSTNISPKGKISGVFAITDRRVLFVNSKLGVGDTKQILRENITSIDTAKSLINCPVRIKGLTEMFVVDCNSDMQKRILSVLK